MNKEIQDLFRAYLTKPVKPELALEIASDFAMDLINVFGDNLSAETPLKPGWCTFAPFEFILGLNKLLARFKQSGWKELAEAERALLTDHGVLIGALLKQALTNHPDAFPDEDHYQIPDAVAKDLLNLTEK